MTFTLKLRHLFWAGLAALSLTPVAAHADYLFSKVGNWTVVRHNDGDCSIKSTFSQNTSLFVGYSTKAENWTFIIGNPGWQSLQDGKAYTLQFVLDGYDRWQGQFTANHAGNDGVLGMYGVEGKFLISLMRRWRIDVYDVNGNAITSLPLDNSAMAMSQLADCWSSSGGNGQGKRAPREYTM
jgi:hypothetical protein